MSPKKFAKLLELPYRPCVGMLVLNRHGQVWIGRRSPKWLAATEAPIWQMPQGGIEPGELPRDAALRELEEETGILTAVIIAEIPDWLTYDLPPELLGIALKGRYRGQRQRWFALRFNGPDSEVNIQAHEGHKAEFDAWRWVGIDELPDLILPFKRAIYQRVVTEFSPLIDLQPAV